MNTIKTFLDEEEEMLKKLGKFGTPIISKHDEDAKENVLNFHKSSFERRSKMARALRYITEMLDAIKEHGTEDEIKRAERMELKIKEILE